jgi:Ca2+-binding EF-hand superfamily protein
MRGGRGEDGGEEALSSSGPQPLIPDFSLKSTPAPIASFGASSAKFTVKVEERDIKEAEERLRRYDQNRDGVLTADELRSGRWGDDPMQYDRNKDGKLSVTELAVRFANRRIEEAKRSNERQDDRRGSWGGADNGWTRTDRADEEEETRFGDARSYRLTSRDARTNSTKGLPDFFARNDANGDGQVEMHEFSSSWTEETLAEFLKWDLNGDGVITARECMAALEKGARVSSSTPGGSSSAGSGTSSTGGGSSGGGSGAIDPTQLDWAKRQIAKYDLNNDGQLTKNEWEKMLIKPTGADADGDGIITAEEYAAFRSKK